MLSSWKVWSNMTKIAVCVTGQKTCERLINKGAELAKKLSGDITVAHVVKNGENFMENSDTGAALEYLYSIAKGIGAGMSVLRADDVMGTLTDFLTQNSFTHVVMGAQSKDNKGEFINRMEQMLPDIDIVVI